LTVTIFRIHFLLRRKTGGYEDKNMGLSRFDPKPGL